MSLQGTASYFVYFATPTHGSVLLVGCALALLSAKRRPSLSKFTVVAASVFMALALMVAPPGPLPELAAALCAGVLILRAVEGRAGGLLDNRVMQWIGRRSYGMYLWGLTIDALVAGLGVGPGLLRLALDLPLAIAVASLSFVLIERPFLSLKHRFPAGGSGGVHSTVTTSAGTARAGG